VAPRHVVLVGLPGSGKTTVGTLAARELGARFTDLDVVIESRAGKSVSAIFAEQGEPAFRALEASVGAELLEGPPLILAPGGGFFTNADLRERTLAVAYALYMETSPAEAALRLLGAYERPMLKGREPGHQVAQRLAELLAQREAAYLEAPGRVTTDAKSAKDVAAEVVALARKHGGW
jgi:shikimate kinase